MAALALYLLAAVNLAVSAYSLISAMRYRRWLRLQHGPDAEEPSEVAATPSVALLIPCCGLEEGLEENLRALSLQDVPDLELFFIVEAESDPALEVIKTVLAETRPAARVIVSGGARQCAQKIHNLLAGVAEVRGREVLAFADSDIRPPHTWLRELVAPLTRAEVGVSTGYRFYLPERRNLPSLLRSAWNAGVLTLLGDHDHNFAWGGSMALRTEVFRRAAVASAWQGALSDDFALTHAVRKRGYHVEFVPRCLVESRGRLTTRQLLNWCYRQMAITRVYWPNLWRIAGGSQLLYVSFLVAAGLAAAGGDRVAGALLVAVLSLGMASGVLRAAAISSLSPSWKKHLRAYIGAYGLTVPLVGCLTAYGFVRSAWSRRIEWRGKTYEMRSPSETIVLGGDANRPSHRRSVRGEE